MFPDILPSTCSSHHGMSCAIKTVALSMLHWHSLNNLRRDSFWNPSECIASELKSIFFHKKSRLCFIINLLIYLCFSDIDLQVIVHGFIINKFSNTYCIKKSNCEKSFAIYSWQSSFIIIITKCASSAFKSCINWRRRKTAPNCHKKGKILDWVKCHLWINSSRFKFLSKE